MKSPFKPIQQDLADIDTLEFAVVLMLSMIGSILSFLAIALLIPEPYNLRFIIPGAVGFLLLGTQVRWLMGLPPRLQTTKTTDNKNKPNDE